MGWGWYSSSEKILQRAGLKIRPVRTPGLQCGAIAEGGFIIHSHQARRPNQSAARGRFPFRFRTSDAYALLQRGERVLLASMRWERVRILSAGEDRARSARRAEAIPKQLHVPPGRNSTRPRTADSRSNQFLRDSYRCPWSSGYASTHAGGKKLPQAIIYHQSRPRQTAPACERRRHQASSTL